MTTDRTEAVRRKPKSGPARARTPRASAQTREGGAHSGQPRSQLPSGLWATLVDLVDAFQPTAFRRLGEEVDASIEHIPTEVNEYGYDRYGFHPDAFRRLSLPGALFYRHYFRVETHDIDRVPAGRVLLVCNHAGQLPFDAMMLATAMLLEAKPPRRVRPMAEYWVSRLPFVSTLAARMGSMVGTRENCLKMLEAGECVMVFPEGVRGLNKLYSERYQLQRFGLGFLRLALQTQTPIVPISLIGSEEQQPGLANLESFGRLLGMPALPITPTFPLLGPLGLMPLPVKYRFYFGEPLLFEGDPSDEEAAIQRHADVVRESMEAMFERGLREREGVFR